MVFQAAERIAQLDSGPRGPGVRAARRASGAQPRPEVRRPDRPARRQPRLPADRLARAGRRGVLPGDRGRPEERRPPPRAAQRRTHRRLRRGRVARRRGRHRAADRRRGRADGAAVARAGPLHALDRGHDPGRAGPGDPGALARRHHDLRRAGHGQDGGRPAPGGVLALHRPPPLRERRSARRRPERRLHALHRAGVPSLGETAVALRSLGEVVDGVRATRHDEPAVADVNGSAGWPS